jgi:hypothetical protein
MERIRWLLSEWIEEFSRVIKVVAMLIEKEKEKSSLATCYNTHRYHKELFR